ncbi:CASP-like protein 1C2 [Forsythia ovata]|uniref:CASP-like protein n=1 Tax=Forsythia ovata TaxID=205694 RepID=A0ABD1R473_9LAMI
MAKPKHTIILRGSTSLLLLIAAIVMLVSYQKVDMMSIGTEFIAIYKDWDSFTASMVVGFIGSIYNFSVLFLPVGSMLWRLVLVVDMILSMLIGGSLSAAWQTFALIKNGAHHVGWFPICKVVPHFCSSVVGSLTVASIGLTLNLVLLLWSLHIVLNPLLLEEP